MKFPIALIFVNMTLTTWVGQVFWPDVHSAVIVSALWVAALVGLVVGVVVVRLGRWP